MLTISLDEAGKFDSGRIGQKWESKTTLIGGVLFDDLEIDGELENERKRIEAYCRTVINSVTLENRGILALFPDSLHSDGQNGSTVKAVKIKIAETLGEFIDKGTYAGKELEYDDTVLAPREGRYAICAIVKSAHGKEALLRSELGDFFRDGVASNLYFHMASEAVEHFVFHNPLYPQGGKFKLDIATRISAEIDENKMDPYILQGMNKLGRKNQFFLTNADVFRTILTEQMMGEKKKNIQIASFMVDSIVYERERLRNNTSEGEWYSNYLFLYLADIVCSFLTYDIKTDDVYEVIRRTEKLTGSNNLIFAYDEVDEYFKRAWRDIETGEYCKALGEAFLINSMRTDEAELYKEKWIPFIEETVINKIVNEKIINDMKSVFFTEVQKLRNSYMTNSLNAEEALYIFEIFKKASEMIGAENQADKLLYYLNDIAVKAYCHRGDTARVEPYFEKCEEYACAVDVEEYVRTRNQYATALCDVFDYKKAVEIANDTVSIAKGIYDLSINLRGKNEKEHFGKTEFAKTLSLAGQFAAFMKDNESALSLFDDALRFMKDDVVNTKITESYKLHLLIQMGDKENYSEAMTDYCNGASTIKGQLAIIDKMEKDGEISGKYAMYIFLKGLYYFHEEDEIKEIWDMIKILVEGIPQEKKYDHPWELIYKYLGLLAIRQNEEDTAWKCIKLIDVVTDNKKDTLIDVIALESKAFLYSATNEQMKEGQLYNEAYDKLREKYGLFNDISEEDPDKIKRSVRDRLSYMYY